MQLLVACDLSEEKCVFASFFTTTSICRLEIKLTRIIWSLSNYVLVHQHEKVRRTSATSEI